MKFSIKISIIATILLASVLFLSSFVGVARRGSSPGIIQFKGDAGTESIFTIEKWEFKRKDINPMDVENLKVEAEMNMSSIHCDWNALLKNVKKKEDYFYVKKFSTATLSIDKATKIKENEYTCEAMLELKGVKKAVTLTFALINNEGKMTVKGQGSLNRRDFNFTGDGPQDIVPITFEFKL